MVTAAEKLERALYRPPSEPKISVRKKAEVVADNLLKKITKKIKKAMASAHPFVYMTAKISYQDAPFAEKVSFAARKMVATTLRKKGHQVALERNDSEERWNTDDGMSPRWFIYTWTINVMKKRKTA